MMNATSARTFVHLEGSSSMKRLVLLVLGIAAAATAAHAQSNAELIEGALAAAPVRARDAAAVIQWNADFTYETLKEGTNRLVCYHRSDEGPAAALRGAVHERGQPRARRPEPAVPGRGGAGRGGRARHGGRGRARRHPRAARVRLGVHLDERPRPGQRAHPHHHRGARRHPPTRSGCRTTPGQGGAWLMAVGTTTAHIMIPGH